MKKVTKSRVIAQLKKMPEGEILPVTLFPSNCGPANTTWVKGFEIQLNNEFLQPAYKDAEFTGFDSLVSDFSYYNCNSELGKRVHFYINE